MMDNGDSEGSKGMGDRRILDGYNVHCSSDGCTEEPDITTVQYINVAKLHFYSVHIYK